MPAKLNTPLLLLGAIFLRDVTADGFCEVASSGSTCNICNPGEVAIGTTSTCNTFGSCDPNSTGCFPDCSTGLGAIFDSNCNFETISANQDFCSGGWDNGWGAYCEGPDGAVNEIYQLDGSTLDDYGYCYVPSGIDTCYYEALGLSSTTNQVSYCCKFVAAIPGQSG
jgi:hypothetical protein